MATDVEESDTDDHERSTPPKRQRTRLVGAKESYDSQNERSEEQDPRNKEEEEEEEEEEDEEEEERRKLNIWQECQVAKGFLDNTINCIVEDYILNPSVAYSLADDSESRLFRDNDMEDTAVTMAIRNRGLVHTAPYVNLVPDVRWSNDENSNQSPPIDRSTLTENLPSSSAIFEPSRSIDNVDRRRGVGNGVGGSGGSGGASRWNEDKMDESDREQDFLERAVAEAIKKKGLSALSVDYG